MNEKLLDKVAEIVNGIKENLYQWMSTDVKEISTDKWVSKIHSLYEDYLLFEKVECHACKGTTRVLRKEINAVSYDDGVECPLCENGVIRKRRQIEVECEKYIKNHPDCECTDTRCDNLVHVSYKVKNRIECKTNGKKNREMTIEDLRRGR